MLDRLYHVDSVERVVRNAIFEGRTESQALMIVRVALQHSALCTGVAGSAG